ncbi:MAG: transglutaminase domain-containing protein, partial [Elusimicrobiota bacterium]
TSELRYRVAVPTSYFGRPVAEGLPFRAPASIPAEVRQALGLMGLSGAETDFRVVLHALVDYFRGFSLEENGIKRHGGSLYLDLVLSKSGVCRHRAFAFARTALGLGIPVRYVESDIHAWAEILVPGRGWQRIDLGGGGDPMSMDLASLAGERHQPRHNDGLPEPEEHRRNAEGYAQRTQKALERQGIEQHCGGGACKAGSGSGEEGAKSLAADSARMNREIKNLDRALAKDALLHDELAPLFASGRGDTQFVFDRMLRALQDRVRIVKLKVKRGLEIDPLAFMLRKPKPFVKRKREEKLQTTAAAVLLDFSGSMIGVKTQLAYTIAAVGDNFWRLREAAPEHFFYDLSEFTRTPTTSVKMGARVSAQDNADRLVAMANRAGEGGTDICAALESKLRDFLASRRAHAARVKYVVLYTDGADEGAVHSVDGRPRLTQRAESLLESYARAGIDVIVIGYGPAAEQVRAFDGPGRHHVRIDASRSEDIAEAIAKIAELKGRGAGRLPDGELNSLLQIAPHPGPILD